MPRVKTKKRRTRDLQSEIFDPRRRNISNVGEALVKAARRLSESS